MVAILAHHGQRTVSVVARAAEQLVADLFLNHHRDGFGLRQLAHQLGQHVGRDVIRQIGGDAQRRTIRAECFRHERGEACSHHIVADYARVGVFFQRYIQNRNQRAVDFKRNNLFGALGERLGQRAEPRADFQNAILSCNQGKLGQLRKQGFVLNKILTQTVFLMKRAMFLGFQNGNPP